MNKIGWATDTLNPLTGCTNFNTQHCGDYCYAARMAKRLAGRFGYPEDNPFQVTFHPEVLKKIREIPGKGKRVFLNSMGDWFCEGIPLAWIDQVLDVIDWVPQHHFLVLTKRPERILEVLHCRNLPPNLWLGVSVTCQSETHRIWQLTDAVPRVHKFVSFEPLHSYIKTSLDGIEWVIIGAESGNSKNKITPAESWVSDLVGAVPITIPLFMKNNIAPYSRVDFQQFPLCMRR